MVGASSCLCLFVQFAGTSATSTPTDPAIKEYSQQELEALLILGLSLKSACGACLGGALEDLHVVRFRTHLAIGGVEYTAMGRRRGGGYYPDVGASQCVIDGTFKPKDSIIKRLTKTGLWWMRTSFFALGALYSLLRSCTFNSPKKTKTLKKIPGKEMATKIKLVHSHGFNQGGSQVDHKGVESRRAEPVRNAHQCLSEQTVEKRRRMRATSQALPFWHCPPRSYDVKISRDIVNTSRIMQAQRLNSPRRTR
ncbi:hypothetical protein C8T65DRAFT_695092 [Cerioporus squamosus]|nr:hypothetical protein C8T65DRAFT_695092 [Cerioporus squamosus]